MFIAISGIIIYESCWNCRFSPVTYLMNVFFFQSVYSTQSLTEAYNAIHKFSYDKQLKQSVGSGVFVMLFLWVEWKRVYSLLAASQSIMGKKYLSTTTPHSHS